MNIRCPSCNATLQYSPNTGKMHCTYCHNSYNPNQLDPFPDNQINSTDSSEKIKIRKRNFETIQVQTASCTSCGAKLVTNDMEISSFCPYCGQATIVQSRMEDYLKPDYIIPFKITRDEAYSLLKGSIKKSRFLPSDFKNIKIDNLRGIYIPFWLYDVYCEDIQKWSVSDPSNIAGNHIITRAVNAHFSNFTADASEQFNDESSQRLEPFDFSELIPFHPAYLSGFYADRFDVNGAAPKLIAKARILELVNDSVKKSFDQSAVFQSRHPMLEIEHEKYALLPVWFLTFRYKEHTYTVLVNGQTGKLVGAFPFSKPKVYTFITFVTIIIAIILNLILSSALYTFCNPRILYIVSPFFLYLWKMAYDKYRSVMNSLSLTTSNETKNFAFEGRSDL